MSCSSVSTPKQENGEKKVIVAKLKGDVAGYVTLIIGRYHGDCRFQCLDKIPEARSIGDKILDIAVHLAGEYCSRVSLGVSMNSNLKMGQSEEIAKPALFLASNDSSFVNATVVIADAGWTAY